MKQIEVDKSDVLLTIIAAAGEGELHRVQLQKVAFLVSEEFKGRLPADFYCFNKHHYGPFSIEIYNDTEMLHYWGWIQVKSGVERRFDSYSVSEPINFDGIHLPTDLKDFIKATVEWVMDMSFRELVSAVYMLFPEYRVNSIFDYSEEQAVLDSFARSMKQLREGKTYPARERLSDLRKAMQVHG